MYVYINSTLKNRSFIKRFSHSARFNKAIRLLSPSDGDVILDYGTGDGTLLSRILQENRQCRIVGYEPMKIMVENIMRNIGDEVKAGLVAIAGDTKQPDKTYTKISCLEVLEHLPREQQVVALKEMNRLLRDDGVLVLSVPIETGPSSLIKNVIRLIVRQPHDNSSFRNAILSCFGVPFHRGGIPGYIYGHLGFNFRDLRSVFAECGFAVKRREFTPIPMFGSMLNSQVFYILEKNSKSQGGALAANRHRARPVA